MGDELNTNLEYAMECIHKAMRYIRKAIREGKEVDGHLEDVQSKLSEAMDIIDLVDQENKGTGEKSLAELDKASSEGETI